MPFWRWNRKEAEPEPATLGLCISYPKSGRTWLRVMLDSLGLPLEFKHAGAAYHQRQFRPPADFIGAQRILFLYRDPIDTTVSGYFHVTRREAWRKLFDGDVGSFVRDPRLGIERTLRFNQAWLAALKDRTDAMVVSYEELQEDTPGALRKITAWLGWQFEPEVLRAVASSASFDAMQAKEATGAFEEDYDHRLRPGDLADLDSFKVRKGKVGGYRDYLSADNIAFCQEIIARFR